MWMRRAIVEKLVMTATLYANLAYGMVSRVPLFGG
jgi:hypothetical protein